jgi:O-acetylhomoserine (thiol)-lyase
MNIETKCIHSGYAPGNTEPRVMPIVQSTTYVFDSAESVGAVFDDPTLALIYSRFANPTVMAVEAKIADLEGGLAAMCTSSGQAATTLSILNLCGAGDSFISTMQIYGGSYNLFSVTLKKFGIECIMLDCDATPEEIDAAFKPNTKAVFAESIANPAMAVLDFDKWSKAAHKRGVPLIIDNTFATPILCRPLEHGADIVIHATTKYMDGHALQVGGVIVDGGKFDWANGNFPDFTQPDASYHGINYTDAYGKAAYIIKARMQLMRDLGVYPAAHSAFILNIGLETLNLRMARHTENAMAVAEFLQSSDKIEAVDYPGLPDSPYHSLAKKYLSGTSGMLRIKIKGGKTSAVKFIDALKLVSNEIHCCEIHSCVLHPATTTHRQLSGEQLAAAGIDPGQVRISVGLENIEDILEDLKQALAVV